MQNEIEVMRVIRVPPMGSLVVQAGGQRLTKLSAVRDEKLQRRLLAAIGELVAFAGGYRALVEVGVAPPLAGTTAQASLRGPVEEAELTKEQAAFLDQLERELRNNNVAEGLSPDAVIRAAQEQGALNTSGPQTTRPASANLVAEIDAILQKHVAANLSLAHRSIQLRQSPGERLQIVVDQKVYNQPNEIEEESVRQVLKRALKEWEAR